MGVKTTQDNREIVNNKPVIVLAVKPNMVKRVLREVHPLITKDHLFISVAAGISLDTLQQVCVYRPGCNVWQISKKICLAPINQIQMTTLQSNIENLMLSFILK